MSTQTLARIASQTDEENAATRQKIAENAALVERLRAIESELHTLRERMAQITSDRLFRGQFNRPRGVRSALFS